MSRNNKIMFGKCKFDIYLYRKKKFVIENDIQSIFAYDMC